MYLAQHADACYKEFGDQYYEIHKFLDQYQGEYEEYETLHRIFLHHRLGVELIVKKFDDDNMCGSAELHIRQDLGGELPEDWSFYKNDKFYQEDDQLRQKINLELRDLYGDEIFERVK